MLLLVTIGSFSIAFFLSWGLNSLALIPWRRSAGQHWTERARLLYPAVRSGRINIYLFSVGLGIVFSLISNEFFFLPMAFGFLGTLPANYFFNREIYPEMQFKEWLHWIIAVVVLLFSWLLILVAVIFTMPANFGPLTWFIAGDVLILMFAFLFGLPLALLRRLGVVQPATDKLKTLVAEVSQQMGVPVRAAWILDTFVTNAAAFPHTHELIFTNKLLSAAPDEEIKAICAHELGHINESRVVLLARSFVYFAFFPLIFTNPLLTFGRNGMLTAFALFILGLIALAVTVRVARRMEKRADKIAVENQTDTAVYAQALKRLYELNHAPAVMPKRSNKIHPDLYDRMTAAGVTPDFPKPAPAKSVSWTTRFLIVCFFAVPIAILMMKAIVPLLPTPIQ